MLTMEGFAGNFWAARKGILVGGLLFVIALVGAMSGCTEGESQADKLARANTLGEVVEVVARTAPASAYTVDSTKYLAVVFETTNVTRDYHLLTTKRLMPVLLERYPGIDRFFLAWAKDEKQFLKIQFDRADVAGVRWEALIIKDDSLQRLSSMYWTIPALR
ncbi:hypothetical protein [Pseudomonas sp. Marseille-Q8238]